MIVERFNRPDTYAVWSKDKDIRYNSTSGGAFSEFAKAIFVQKGEVVGAQYNESNMVEHSIISDLDGLKRIRQSKYISSKPGDIFKVVKSKLDNGTIIGFCGSPCQVAGLYAYLGKSYENLFTMDFICRGMNSPKALRSWIEEIENQEYSKVTRVWFKYKEGGWKTSPKRTRLDFEDGHYIVKEGEKNLFMHGYLTSNLYIRPCCGACQFKGVPRQADVTLADFWGINKELDDDKGTSMILINSEKGRYYFDIIKEELNYYRREFDEIFAGNVCFSNSVKVPEESYGFLSDLDTISFTDALKKYGVYPLPVPQWKKMLRKSNYAAKRIVKKALGR